MGHLAKVLQRRSFIKTEQELAYEKTGNITIALNHDSQDERRETHRRHRRKKITGIKI